MLTQIELILELSNTITDIIANDQEELIKRGEEEGMKLDVQFIQHANVQVEGEIDVEEVQVEEDDEEDIEPNVLVTQHANV